MGVATPMTMVAYVVVDGKTVMSGSRMTIIAGVFSICAILCYIVCFKLTRERVEVPASSQKVSASAIFKSIFTNRALLGIIVAAIFVLLSQLTVMSLAGYVYPNVYGSAAAQSTASLLGTVVMLIVCAPFASKLAAKFGKKELAVASSICSALVWLVCLIWRPASVWGFVACYILANVGKVLNPVFLALLFLVFVVAFASPLGNPATAPVTTTYVHHALVNGFLEGYNTMDALAGLAFGVTVVTAVRSMGQIGRAHV